MTRRFFALLGFALLAACGDLEIRSVAPTVTPSEALGGVWTGTWVSEQAAAGPAGAPAGTEEGSLTVEIQLFDGQPIVRVDINNPCLPPRDYALVVSGGTISLEDAGVPVLRAALVSPGELVGSYECEADRGSWRATRTAVLPEPLDLSGEWAGTIFVPGQFDEPFMLRLQQSVQSGLLRLDGSIDLPAAVPFPLPVEGLVRFVEDGFDLLLQTAPGFQPRLQLVGIGTRDPLEVPLGSVRVLGGSQLPFAEAFLRLERLP